jgi:hypothetical protein
MQEAARPPPCRRLVEGALVAAMVLRLAVLVVALLG